MNVLSLFDGMSCGRIALERAGIPVENYYASEIDKYAIQVSKANYPDIVHIGDVTKVDGAFLPHTIDLLIGGSPCQGFSFAGKGLNFDDPRSKLFFEFVRILKEIRAENPKVKFLLENVKMKKEYQDVISGYLGCQPIMINSALVSAQNRRRLYWTNIPGIGQPADKRIFLKDILEEQVDAKYLITDVAKARIMRKGYSQPKFNPDKTGAMNTKNNSGQLSIDSGTTFIISDRGPASSFITNTEKIPTLSARRGCSHDNTLVKIDIFGKQKQNQDKASCFCGGAHSGGNHSDMYLIVRDKNVQKLLDIDSAYVNNNPTFCVKGDILSRDYPERQHGMDSEKSFALRSAVNHGLYDHQEIRRLTPVECERLQTVPDNYTSAVSDSQRYKMLGNGWTVDVIAHIFKGLNAYDNWINS